ncbi:MAG: hypothetical protein ACR2H5_02625 [Ktedonobacteraceae bacterium]
MINQYEQGLPAQPFQSQQQLQPTQQVQEVKFYKSGIFSFRSAVGRFQSDCQQMIAAGWKLQYASFLGLNFWLSRVIVASYVR